MEKPHLTWAEIDLKALAHNIKEIRKQTPKNAAMMAAVKADAYGHGAFEVARTVLENGVSHLAVARIEEAIFLRKAGIDAPILLLGYCQNEYVVEAIDFNIHVSVNSVADAKRLSTEALKLSKILFIHVKIDTGMGRLGIVTNGNAKNAFIEVQKIVSMEGLHVEGIFTHFAKADSIDKSSALAQFNDFKELLSMISEAGIIIKYIHAANSAASIEMPNAHFNMVRPGISIYGLWPSNEVKRSDVELRPVMSLKSQIIQLKAVDAGFHVSYGGTYITQKPTVIATVPVGYGDGYDRGFTNKGVMLVHGVRANIAGRVCMDLTMIDVGHIKDVAVGDEVVVFGAQGSEQISADELADFIGTINYEIVTTIMPRVKRVYVGQK